MTTYIVSSPAAEIKARLNIYRFASSDKTLPTLNVVRVRNEAGSNRVYLAATDRYRLAEVVLTLSEPTAEGFEVFVNAEDLNNVAKAVRVSARGEGFSFTINGDQTVTFNVWGQVFGARGNDSGVKYPLTDRLWPELDKMVEPEGEGERGYMMFNSRYLDSFRNLNHKEKDMLRVITTAGARKPVIVVGSGGWRGMVVPVSIYGGKPEVEDNYRNWDRK